MPDIRDKTMINGESEEFWDDLIAFIEAGKVIPVVGEELRTVQDGGQEVHLSAHLASRLLEKYELKPVMEPTQSLADTEVLLRQHQELNDAVCALVQQGRRVQDLYRPINDLLREILKAAPAVPEALKQLARIRKFDLFITSTFDDLLTRALDQERFRGEPGTLKILYAPTLPAEQARDIPENVSNCCAVFYLFGQASPSPFYAIHDEDTLEFVYSLQAGRGIIPERLLSQVRSRDLLFIGCNLADWLSRFFIRLSNQSRLSDANRAKKEFLVGDQLSRDSSLTMFLKRFSQNTRMYPGDARGFVAELFRRWKERHPDVPEAAGPGLVDSKETTDVGAIFISYSRTDSAAAQILSSELQALGAAVIWLDKTQMLPGDVWERKIREAIKHCYLFLPLFSAATNDREEGYFYEEWLQGAARSRLIRGRTFIIPVVVDADYDDNFNKFTRKPDEFEAFNACHAPDGHIGDELKKTIVALLRDQRRSK